MAQINMAQRPESGLDALAKALNVAQSIYGISSDMSRLNMAKEAQAKQAEAEQRAKEGFLSSKEALEYAKDYNISDQATPGAFQRKLQEGDQVREIYLSPKNTPAENKFALSQDKAVEIVSNGGKFVQPGQGTMDVSVVGADGKPRLVGLVPPKAKAGLSDYIQSLDARMKEFNLAKAQGEANSEEAAFKKLPVEKQKQIEFLAGKNASKADIQASINSALEIFRDPKVPEDQKVKLGQGLIKTLNSEQGQDAVGAEEAKRLGSFLEFKLANVTQPGSFIGRDLDKFIEQAELTSKKIGATVEKNQAKINELYGRSNQAVAFDTSKVPGSASGGSRGVIPEAKAQGGIGKLDAQDIQALEWLKSNPNDPNAAGVRAKLRAKGAL